MRTSYATTGYIASTFDLDHQYILFKWFKSFPKCLFI